MLDLETIFERCAAGDKLAWEALVRETQSRIYGLALFYVKDTGEAEDLAQEIFVRIYRNLHQVKESSGFRAWMFAIARNCCRDRRRRIKTSPEIQSAELIQFRRCLWALNLGNFNKPYKGLAEREKETCNSIS